MSGTVENKDFIMSFNKKSLFFISYIGVMLVGSIITINRECQSTVDSPEVLLPEASLEVSHSKESCSGYSEEIAELLSKRVAETSIAGIAVGYVDNGTIQYYSAGRKSFDGNEPITEKSVFEIGSITKSFATLVLMDLVNKGIVGLDDPIEQYMSGISVPHKNGKKITFRHLATHTSGLPRMPNNFVYDDPEGLISPFATYTKELLYRFLRTHRLAKEPGTEYEYSNLGVGLLGEILSMISNKTFEELVHERICTPLHMKATGVSLTPSMQEKLTQGYCDLKKVDPWDFRTLQAAGSLRSSVEDMTKYLLAHMGLVDFDLFKAMKECHASQFSHTPDGEIGLGWMVEKTKNGDSIINHGGLTGGYCCFIGFNSAAGKGVVILTNSTCGQDDLGFRLLDLECS